MATPKVSTVSAETPTPFLLRDGSGSGDAVSTRYEYRAWFSTVPGAIQTLQRSWDFTSAERRIDIYLLSPRRPLTLAKLRGGKRLEVKRLVRCAGPHQVWAIKRYGAFPLASGDMARFAELMGIEAQAPGLNGADADTFLSSVIEASALIEPVAARKSRLLFAREGCQAEIARVQSAGFQAFTAAIEAEDRWSADSAIRSLRLTGSANMAYGEALWRGVFGKRGARTRDRLPQAYTQRLASRMKGLPHETA